MRADRRRGIGALAALGLAAALALSGCSSSASDDGVNITGGDDDGMHGAVLTEPYQVPDDGLTDTDGEQFSLAGSTEKPLTLLFFGYTNCPDICNIVMSSLASALNQLDDADRDQVEVVFVTTDPARDDEQTIRQYLDRFDPSFIGATGDLEQIKADAEQLGVSIEKGKKLPSGGYEVDHSTPVIGIEADDTAPIVWTQGTSAAQFAEDITRLLDK